MKSGDINMIQTMSKAERIDIRISEDAKRVIEKAASFGGKTVSAYIVEKSLSSARDDIREMESLTLSSNDRDMFFSLLSNPPQPNDALISLMKSSNPDL